MTNDTDLSFEKPFLSENQLDDMESVATASEVGIARRAMFASLARTGFELAIASQREPEGFTAAVEAVEGLQKHLRLLTELSDTALMRFRAAQSLAEICGNFVDSEGAR